MPLCCGCDGLFLRYLLANSPTLPAHAAAVFVGSQTGRVDAMNRQFLVAILGIAGYADRANDFATIVADQHAAAFGKDLLAARGNQITHEDRPFVRPLADEFRAAAERQRRIGFTESHFEADHGSAVLFLERLHFASRLDDDDADRTKIKRRAPLDNRHR